MLHTYPLNDLREHELTTTCPCCPTVDWDIGYVLHNSFDRREVVERAKDIVGLGDSPAPSTGSLSSDSQAAIESFMGGERHGYIAEKQRLAKQYGRCNEAIDGVCMYPHCGCLFGDNGPIDPITGEEMKD